MFTVDVRSITHTEATVVVNPVDPAMPYTFDVIEKAAFDRNYNGSVEAVVNGYIDYMTQEEKMPLAEVLENMRSVGDDYYDFSTLDPETDYVAYAIGLGDSGTCTTLPTVKQFRTADLDPVKPKDCTFRVSVSDISVTRAIIDVEPSDKTVPYYFDVIAADRLAAADSPAAALEELMAEGIAYFRSQGYSLEDAIKELRSVGNDGIDLEYGTLKALTKYSVVAGGIDEWGRVNTEVATKEFTTQAVSPSDNTFSIAVEEITAIGAMVTVTPTNNDPYYAAVFEAAGLEGRTDAEIVAAVEQTGSIDWQTRTGKGELDYSQDLESDTNYLVVVFGYREGATTPVSRQTFRTEQGGDPAPVSYTHLDVYKRQVMLDFKNNKIDILVATDIVARGIDIEDIGLIINYDVPHDPEDYIHRIGRTARAAATGAAITFVNEEEQGKFHQIEKFIEREIRKCELPASVGEGPVYNPAVNNGRGAGRGRGGRSGAGAGSGGGRGRGRDRKGGERREGGRRETPREKEAVQVAAAPVSAAETPVGEQRSGSNRGEGNRGSRDRRRNRNRHRRGGQRQAQSAVPAAEKTPDGGGKAEA